MDPDSADQKVHIQLPILKASILNLLSSARRLEIEERLNEERLALQRMHVDQTEEQASPVASTSAVTLDQPAPVEKPWGLAEYGIPPPPSDVLPDPTVAAKLKHFHALRAQNIRFNATLQGNKSFRNPSILSKLVDFVAVDESLSAFPKDVWPSADGLGKESFADAIAEKQKLLSEQRQKAQERGKRDKISFASASSASTENKYSAAIASESKSEKSRSRHGKDDYSHRSTDSSSRRRDRDRGRDPLASRDRSRSPARR